MEDEYKPAFPDSIQEKHFFHECLAPAEYLHFFVEAVDAIYLKLPLAALASLVIGIESSIKSHLLESRVNNTGDASDDRISASAMEIYQAPALTPKRLRQASDLGMPISALSSIKDPAPVAELLRSNKTNIRIIALRNQIAHGATFESSETFEDSYIFTPEMMHPLLYEAYAISLNWCRALCHWRRLKSDPPPNQECPSQPTTSLCEKVMTTYRPSFACY